MPACDFTMHLFTVSERPSSSQTLHPWRRFKYKIVRRRIQKKTKFYIDRLHIKINIPSHNSPAPFEVRDISPCWLHAVTHCIWVSKSCHIINRPFRYQIPALVFTKIIPQLMIWTLNQNRLLTPFLWSLTLPTHTWPVAAKTAAAELSALCTMYRTTILYGYYWLPKGNVRKLLLWHVYTSHAAHAVT